MGDGDGARERTRGATRTAVTPHGAKVRLGQERARARGVHVGRPHNAALTPDVLERARALRAAGIRVRDIASELHVPKSTLHRALHRETMNGARAVAVRASADHLSAGGTPRAGTRRPRPELRRREQGAR
jgi:hypothetical protein